MAWHVCHEMLNSPRYDVTVIKDQYTWQLPIVSNRVATRYSTLWVKTPPPLRFCDILSQTVGNFKTKFHTIITRSYLRWTTFFVQLSAIFTNLCHRPTKRDHPVHTMLKMSTIGRPKHTLTFSDIPQTVGNFWSKFYTPRLLHIPIYAIDYIFFLSN